MIATATLTEIIPRPYQTEALDGIRSAFQQHDSALLVMATGLGKTITFSELSGEFMSLGRIMVLAHREELISQAYDKLLKITGCAPDVEMADYRANAYGVFRSQVVVSTIQTQISGMGGKGRMSKFDPDEFSLLIIDEAHHSAAKSYRRVIDYYRQNPKLKVLGVTATPDRADEKALGQIFESVAYEFDIRAGVDAGWLVPIRQQSVYVNGLDYSNIRTTAGDLNGKDLARVLEFEEALHGIASPTIELCGDRKALVFAASLAQAERLTEILNRHKDGSARWVHGGTPKDTPLCDRPDWCSVSENGQVVCCMRVESSKPCKSGGWFHNLSELVKYKPAPKREVAQVKEFTAAASQYVDNITDYTPLANELGVSARSLERLDVGWNGNWTFPMRDGQERIIGIRVRGTKGKWCIRGSHNGLFWPEGVYSGSDWPVVIAEGPTDVAALLDMEFDAIGRPSCLGGADHIVEFLKGRRRDVVIMADRDEPKNRPDGSVWYPGQEGAAKLSRAVLPLVKSLRIVKPPFHKDIREWRRAGATKQVVESIIRNTGYVA